MIVVVTGAAGQIGYSLIPLIASGHTFGESQRIELRLLEIPQAMPLLNGLKMELLDCAYPMIDDIVCTSDPCVAFENADVAFLVGGFPRRPGMLRKDLIQKNSPIFMNMGKVLDSKAKSTCKVLVIANPANTNCLIALKQCSRIPPKNFCAMTSLDLNRARAQIANELDVSVSKVKNVIIWGNHSASQFPDALTTGRIADDTESQSLKDVFASNLDWIRGDFIEAVQQRGKMVMEARGKSSALSAAKAASDCVRTWLITGTAAEETVSMGVYNHCGAYGIDSDIVFSFPCVCKDGEWTIKTDLKLDSFTMEKIKYTENELINERKFCVC